MKEKTEKIYTNSLTDLVAGVRVASMITGGSDLAGYGTIAYNNNYSLLTLNRVILTYLYTSSGIIQTAIDLPTQDALSKGIEIETGQMSASDIDELLDFMEETEQWETLRHAWNWSRLYGGAGLVLNTNQDPKEPLNYKRLNRTPIEFYDVDRWQFDNAHPYSGDYEDYFLHGNDQNMYYLYGQPIHESRVIRMRGRRAPYYVRRQLRGWGMSEAERMIPPLNLYLKTQNVLYEILDESKVDVYKIKGFAQKLINEAGTSNMTRRIQLANEMKNYVNALVMDMDDDYEQKQMSFGGLAEISQENRIGIASALRMPITKLFGLSASGFNTGESDLENYNLMIESDVRTKMKPVIRKMIEINMYHLWGRAAPFQIKFPSLRVLSTEQEESVKDSQFNRTMALYDRGILDSEEVGQALRKDDIISIETKAEQGLLPAQPEAPNGADSVTPAITSPGRTEGSRRKSETGLAKNSIMQRFKIKKNQSKDAKFEKVMKEFEAGTLKSSDGKTVTDRDQALAIAYSESGQSRK